MPTIRTRLRPDLDVDVDDAEVEVLRAMGLLHTPPVAEEVSADGDSEEGDEGHGVPGRGGADREEERREPDQGGGDPGGVQPKSKPGGKESQPEPEKGPEEEGKVT